VIKPREKSRAIKQLPTESDHAMQIKPILLTVLLMPVVALAQASKPAGPPPTLKSVLLAQLRSTHNKAEWFVPVNTAVAGLTPEQARWIPKSEGPRNPAPEDHSVGMLAYHLLYWNTQALTQLKGEKVPPPTSDNNETFNKFDATSWPDTVKKLDENLTALEQLVEAADDAKIAAIANTIAHISAHNAYHTGQIVMIRKLQGSWDPEKGVK
jgi:uncharacterized damage-inducible protein DinB